MIITPKHGLSVNLLVKSLIDQPDVRAEVQAGDAVHTFRLTRYTCGTPYRLEYTTPDYNGDPRRWWWSLESRASNLPGVEAERWYIYHPPTGKLAEKLHLKAFLNGIFFICRHDYRHTYASQQLSHRRRIFQYHDFEEKHDQLIEGKKKLRLTYGGKPTRTARRLDYFKERYDHYEQLSLLDMVRFLAAVWRRASNYV